MNFTVEEISLMLFFFTKNLVFLYRKFLELLCFDIVDIIYILKQPNGVKKGRSETWWRPGHGNDSVPFQSIDLKKKFST
jgi:hypothetical protein